MRLFKELKESLEQQTATSEILGVIASSPTDIQPVLDTVAKNAARLCEAADAQIRLIETDRTRLVASFGSLPAPEFAPISSLNPSGRAILTRQTLHVHDLQERKDEFPAEPGFKPGTPDVSQRADDQRRNANWRDQHQTHGSATFLRTTR